MDFLATPAKRKVLFAALYMSEGAPIGFLWWALPTILRSQDVSLEHITTLTSILVLPWALKFLWAPIVDILQSRWPLKLWILTMQALMGLLLLPLLWVDPAENFHLVFIFLLMHSFAAATQDVSIDALCIQVTSINERGVLNGWMQAGMLTGRSLLGGGALILMTSYGFPVVFLFLIAVIWSSSPFLLLSSQPVVQDMKVEKPFHRFQSNLRSAFVHRSTWYALAFAAVAGAGYEAAGAVAGPLLIDKGYSPEHVGWFFLVPAVVCMIAGSLVGGVVADRIPRTRAVRIFLIAMSGSVVLLGGLDLLRESAGGIEFYGGMAVLYFCIGLFVSSSYALFMDLTNPSLGATQFSAFMGGTNLCESWSSFAIGRLAGQWGYAVGFFIMAAISVGAIGILRKLDLQGKPLPG